MKTDVERKTELNDAQRAELRKLETQIKKGQEAFFATCNALVEIERQELYVPYDSLAVYAADKWDFTPSDVSRFKAAARVLKILDGFDKNKLPNNEAQARKLAKLKDEPEALKEVWRKVFATNGKITADLVSTEVKCYLDENGQDSEAVDDADVEVEGTTSHEAVIRKAPPSAIYEIVSVVHALKAIDDELNGADLDDQSRITIEEQLKYIDELASKIRNRLALRVVA